MSPIDTIPRGIACTRLHDCAGNGAGAGKVFIAGRWLCGKRGKRAGGLHRLAGGRTGIPSSAASAGGPIVGAGDIEVGAVLAGRKGAVVLIAFDAAAVAKIAYRTARLAKRQHHFSAGGTNRLWRCAGISAGGATFRRKRPSIERRKAATAAHWKRAARKRAIDGRARRARRIGRRRSCSCRRGRDRDNDFMTVSG